jgi:hypothetical protein
MGLKKYELKQSKKKIKINPGKFFKPELIFQIHNPLNPKANRTKYNDVIISYLYLRN